MCVHALHTPDSHVLIVFLCMRGLHVFTVRLLCKKIRVDVASHNTTRV